MLQLLVKSLIVLSVIVYILSRGFCLTALKMNLDVKPETMEIATKSIFLSLVSSFVLACVYLIYW